MTNVHFIATNLNLKNQNHGSITIIIIISIGNCVTIIKQAYCLHSQFDLQVC